MNFLSAAKMQAGYVIGMNPDGRELLVVVVKATFGIPPSGREAVLASEQAPLVYADTFSGDPGFSSIVHEYDFSTFKPRCDVLLNGSAYAPNGKPVHRLTVGLEVGRIKKRIGVVGDRVWKKGWFRAHPSRPQAFTVMPVSYDRAFGGVDNLHKNPRKHVTCLSNFAGRGFYPRSKRAWIQGKAAPNTEEPGKPVKRPGGHYRPMAFGAIGRPWLPRRAFAGTYDQRWIDNVFPFLPRDFDPRYNQAAPPDQQIDYLQGGEEVKLFNLMPESRVSFRIPRLEMPVVFKRKGEEEISQFAVNDTLLIEPDRQRFILVWRTTFALKKNIFEMEQTVAGRMPRAYYRARETGKRYFPFIDEFAAVRDRRLQALEARSAPDTAEMEVVEDVLAPDDGVPV